MECRFTLKHVRNMIITYRQSKVLPVNYYLSRISTSRNIELKKIVKPSLYYIEFICRPCEKNSSMNFMSSVGFQTSKIWMLFWKIYWEQNLKSFSGRNNSLKSSVLRFSNSLPLGLEESRELRALISWVLG